MPLALADQGSEERVIKPELNHAREAAAQYLARAMDGGMSAEAALCLGSAGFDVAVRALALMRRDHGVSPEGVVAAYEERRDRAIVDEDVQRRIAAEFTLAVWDGMQRDLAEWMAGAGR